MIDIEKTKNDFNIDINDLTSQSAKKVWWSCNTCKVVKLKQYRDCLKSSGLCKKCNGTKNATIMGNKFGKAQQKQGNCLHCSTAIRSNRKTCKEHEKHHRSLIMSGNKNPAYKGTCDIKCECGKAKSFGAVKCRNCSFVSGDRSGVNNGRYISENREEFLAKQKVANIARTVLSNTLTSLAVKKNSRTEKMIGYSFAEFKEHIEKQFEPWMSWENRGLGDSCWTIDHIIPVNYFVKNNIVDPAIVNALWNLRPLPYKDNIVKSDIITEEAQKLIETKLTVTPDKKKIHILAGVSGSGKTWIINQLTNFNCWEADNNIGNILDLLKKSEGNTLYTITVGLSTFIKRYSDVFDISYILIKEAQSVIEGRLLARGGNLTEAVKRRIKRMESLEKDAQFVGTSQEVLEYLLDL